MVGVSNSFKKFKILAISDGPEHSKLFFSLVVCLVTSILISVKTTSIKKSVSITVRIKAFISIQNNQEQE